MQKCTNIHVYFPGLLSGISRGYLGFGVWDLGSGIAFAVTQAST